MLQLSRACGKMKPIVLGLASRRLILTAAKYATGRSNPAPSVFHSHLVKLDASSTLRHPWIIIRRWMKTQSSLKKTGRLIPQYRWDRVPQNCILIYESHLKHYIGYYNLGIAVLLTLSCAALGYELPRHYERMTTEEIYSLILITALLLLVIAPTTWLTSRYVTRIYHDMDNGCFVAVRRTCFGRLKQIRYTAQDVKFSPKRNADVENGADVKIKGITCHLSAADFVSPMYYSVHLGDKSIEDIAKTYASSPKF